MSRQYNMYNVQLSEFWKQRCLKENTQNTPYLFDESDDGRAFDLDIARRLLCGGLASIVLCFTVAALCHEVRCCLLCMC